MSGDFERYDTPTQRIGMVAWTFLYYGHPDVRILDGGLAKWLAEGRELSTEPAPWPPANYVAGPVGAAAYCSLADAKDGVGIGCSTRPVMSTM